MMNFIEYYSNYVLKMTLIFALVFTVTVTGSLVGGYYLGKTHEYNRWVKTGVGMNWIFPSTNKQLVALDAIDGRLGLVDDLLANPPQKGNLAKMIELKMQEEGKQ